MRDVTHAAKALLVDGAVCPEAPVIDEQSDVAINVGRLVLFDDQGALQTARQLFQRSVVRMVPISAGIRWCEAISEPLTGFDSGLCQSRDAVHRVVNANAMPVDRCCLGQLVDQIDSQLVALLHTQFGTRNLTVISPDRRHRLARLQQQSRARSCDDVAWDCILCSGSDRNRTRRNQRCGAGEDVAARINVRSPIHALQRSASCRFGQTQSRCRVLSFPMAFPCRAIRSAFRERICQRRAVCGVTIALCLAPVRAPR